jgi:hypothetical protein
MNDDGQSKQESFRLSGFEYFASPDGKRIERPFAAGLFYTLIAWLLIGFVVAGGARLNLLDRPFQLALGAIAAFTAAMAFAYAYTGSTIGVTPIDTMNAETQ